jgi:glycosyltransferase involved in cell wall biosynthesis
MAAPIRILEVVNVMDRAGLETFLMNHYRHIDRDVVQMDFLTHRPVAGAYDDEIRSLGGRIYRAPRLYPQNWLRYHKWMNSFFAEHDYPVVHSHIDAMSYFPLTMARSNRVTVRVAHSHNDSVDRDVKYPIKEICRRKLPGVATDYWACSQAAGAFLFGERNRDRVHVVKNAIDLSRFGFDPEARRSMRADLGVSEGQLLVGHVGRFSAVKNQSFLLHVLAELVSQGEDAVLALVGDGELREHVEREAGESGLGERVRFLGVRSDVDRLDQAFDILCFPSLHEGIPVSLIEAQASGLPILVSDRVDEAALALPNARRLPLEAPAGEWARSIREMAAGGRDGDPIGRLTEAGYEINESARALQESYLALWGRAGREVPR